jgi:hypothetical protein
MRASLLMGVLAVLTGGETCDQALKLAAYSQPVVNG